MSNDLQQLHNIVTSGKMSDALARALPSFAIHAPALSTRSVCLPISGETVQKWPVVLFQNNVAFNWLFINASDIDSEQTTLLMALAQDIAPTMIFCHTGDEGLETDVVADMMEARSKQGRHGIILSCYIDSTFRALQLLQAFLPKVSRTLKL